MKCPQGGPVSLPHLWPMLTQKQLAEHHNLGAWLGAAEVSDAGYFYTHAVLT